MFIPTMLILGIGIYSAKFLFLSLPFLAIGAANLAKNSQNMRYFIGGLAIAFILIYPITFANQPPTQSTWEAINYLKENFNESEISNEWSYGYWMEFKGIPTTHKGGWAPAFDYNQVVLDHNLPTNGLCDPEPLKQFGDVNIYDCRIK